MEGFGIIYGREGPSILKVAEVGSRMRGVCGSDNKLS